jgi:threonine dehydratase
MPGPKASKAPKPTPLRQTAIGGKTLGLNDYLRKILTARVYDVAIETSLELARNLSKRVHNQVLLKREDSQPVFSFKLRGAYNKLAQLTREQRDRGVICASAGNHAQGVALGAKRLGCKAMIVMPVTTPHLKVDAVKALGGNAETREYPKDDHFSLPASCVGDARAWLNKLRG